MSELAKAYVQIIPTAQGISGTLEDILGGEAEKSGKSAGGKFGNAIGTGIKTAGKVAVAATGVAATAVTALTKSAVSGYADYEQFVGGIETLFGDAKDTVIANAESAFKTAGLSANDYMNTTIESAAAMISSLDGDVDRAADLMDMSIVDMSDNVNKMGTTMESVQNAYRGFSRGNFTMLDNLALGFAGTKEGMQDLLDKAQELSGVEYDISSYADIVQAIHVVQEEMGIAGTTALEAEDTISGSMSSLSAAWSNLVTGLATDGADVDALVGEVVGSAETAVGNLLPVIEQALGGIGEFIGNIGGIIEEIVPVIVEELPELVGAGMLLLDSLAQGLVDNLPAIIDSAIQIMTMLMEGLIENLPMLVEAAIQIIAQLALGLADALPELIPTIVEVLLQIVDTLLDNIDLLLDAALQLMIGLAQGLILALPELIAKAPEIILELVLALAESLPKLLEMGWELIKALGQGIAEAFPGVTEKITGWIDSVGEFLSNAWETIKNVVQVAIRFIEGILKAAFDLLTLPWRFIWENFGEQITAAWEAIKEAVGTAIEWVREKIQMVMDAVLAVVKPILEGIKNAFTTAFNAVKNLVSTVFNAIKNTISTAMNAVKSTVTTILNAVKKTFTDIFDKIKSVISPIIDWLKGIFDFEWSLPKPKLPHFSISGSFSLSPPSVPSLSIDWYGKAMDNAMILSGATIFGMSGDTLLGGGESGDEVIAGAGTLMGMIRDAVGDGTREYNQVINITSPQPLSPYEIARQTRNATRDMVLAARV